MRTKEKTELNHISSKGYSKENITEIVGNPEEHDVTEIMGGNTFKEKIMNTVKCQRKTK